MMAFLPHPYPERITNLGEPDEILSVGLRVVTHDRRGLKIIPVTEVSFVIGDAEDEERNIFNVPTSMARGLATRIVEMCDVAEGKN
jgi:hypothetical protein